MVTPFSFVLTTRIMYMQTDEITNDCKFILFIYIHLS